MENKINIAELLKDCPQGMELDCTMYDNCTYAGIEDVGYIDILINTPSGRIRLTKEGCYIRHDDNAKCVIFPKGKTTWEGFQRPFKDGDIIFVTNNESDEGFHYKYIAIFKEIKRDKDVYVYGLYSYNEDVFSLHPYLCEITNSTIIKFATKEEKEKLFDVIKANGYKWNEETKTLEKLPKFKVGDMIQDVDKYKVKITEVNLEDECYRCESMITKGIGDIPFKEQNIWELVPNKFDITTLKPFDKVLVRDGGETWCINLFGCYNKTDNQYNCIGNTDIGWDECIPYEGNEHLLGTANDCDEYYKTWE